MSQGQRKFADLVELMERILVGHNVTHTVTLHTRREPSEVHEGYREGMATTLWVRWNHLVKHLEWTTGNGWAPIGPNITRSQDDDYLMPASWVGQELCRLVSRAIGEQEDFDFDALAAAGLVETYLQNVGWYRPKDIDPVEPVMPQIGGEQ